MANSIKRYLLIANHSSHREFRDPLSMHLEKTIFPFNLSPVRSFTDFFAHDRNSIGQLLTSIDEKIELSHFGKKFFLELLIIRRKNRMIIRTIRTGI